MATQQVLRDLQNQRARIQAAIDALQDLAGAAPNSASSHRRGGRHMSVAAKKRISDAMKRRWAERKKKGT